MNIFLIEQKYIPSLDTFGNDLDDLSVGVYKMLSDIFESRPNYLERERMERSRERTNEKNEANAKEKALNDELVAGLTAAVHNVLSKMASIEAIPKKDRLAMVDGFMQPVINEFVSHYTDSGIEVPWSNDVISERAKGIIMKIIMNIQFHTT